MCWKFIAQNEIFFKALLHYFVTAFIHVLLLTYSMQNNFNETNKKIHCNSRFKYPIFVNYCVDFNFSYSHCLQGNNKNTAISGAPHHGYIVSGVPTLEVNFVCGTLQAHQLISLYARWVWTAYTSSPPPPLNCALAFRRTSICYR